MLFSCCRTGLFPMRQILSTEYLPFAGPLLFHTIASYHEKESVYVRILRRQRERERARENRDRTNRGKRVPECRHIRDILACFAIFSDSLPSWRNFRERVLNSRSLLLEKYSVQYVDDGIYLPFWGHRF